MSLKIRLARAGAKKRPFYAIVIADSRSPRDGRFIEKLGSFDPMLKEDAQRVVLDAERAQHWLGVGAQPSETVVSILKRSGDWQKFTGEKSESGILPQAEKADKVARFNAALAEADNEPSTSAISRGKKKAAEADETETADEA